MVAAMRIGDYEKLTAYTPKQVVAAMGGKEALIASVRQGIDGMKTSSVSFRDVEIGAPGKVEKMSNWLVSVIPQMVTLNVPGGRLESTAYLIGISEDDGKSWAFVDSTGFTNENEAALAQMFPPLAGRLRVPEKKSPVFTAE